MAQDANRPLVIGSQLVGVLVVILTLMTRQAELRSTRPVGEKTQVKAKLDENNDYSARLWDDPLAPLQTFEVAQAEQTDASRSASSAAATSVQNTERTPAVSPGAGPANTAATSSPAATPPAVTAGPSPSASADRSLESPSGRGERKTSIAQNQQASQQPFTSDSLFLWNIVDARPLPEIKERRLRIRYAVVSALAARGYLPTNESLLVPAGFPTIGYRETFRLAHGLTPGRGGYQDVTLIWVPKQGALAKQSPSSQEPRPSSLWDLPWEKTKKEIVGSGTNVTERFLHHGSSEDFVAYLTAGRREKVSFLRATIPDSQLPKSERGRAHSLRRVMSDDRVIAALADELRLRIPSLNRAPGNESKRPRVVLVTESDTTYSRAMAAEVTKNLKEVAAIEVYTYLQGLDGRPEDVPTSKSEEKTSDVVSSLLRGRAISETSVGTSQFDYLRRLALALEQDKSKNKERGEICAVGILGTDIYDKMLVLQAIRPQLPAAIFFTTDLDALYLQRDNERFTRNLVVGSADKLDLNDGLKGDGDRWKLPPMRDSYQTIVVKHIWQILDSPKDNELPAMKDSQAQLSEIVAGKSIELTAPANPGTRNALLGWLPIAGNLVIFLFGLGNAFVILWAISTRMPTEDQPWNAPMNPTGSKIVYCEIALGILSLLSLLVVFATTMKFLGEEPLTLEASIWPSVTIRILAFVVAIRLLMIASKAFAIRRTRIYEALKDSVPANAVLPLAEGLIKHITVSFVALWWETPPPPRNKTFVSVLDKHFDVAARRKRIMWWAFFYLVISFVLFVMWPPAVPARGVFAFFAEKVVLALGVGLYIIHLMYCLDLHISACTILATLRSFLSLDESEIKPNGGIKTGEMLAAVSEFTSIIGKTLLYPLTILILIIISRLKIFDNWSMTPSLSVTFLLGAVLLVLVSLILWYEGARLMSAVEDYQRRKDAAGRPAEEIKVEEGAFAPWRHQPIFAALLSVVAVFGSLSVAEPLVRLLFGGN
jgi:hypothetical protein